MEKELADRVIGYCSSLPTPCYVLDEQLLIKNLTILKKVMDDTGARILLAQKAFSMYSVYPIIAKYLSGTTASGLYEARLGHEEMPDKEVHVYSPAFKESEIDEIINVSDHIVFNSPKQWMKFKNKIKNVDKKISCGIRINPEYAEIETDIYNPCITGSRLGTKFDDINEEDLDGIEGLHFHTMCEQNSDVLYRTIQKVDEKFGKYLKNMKWINFGGGHHITRPDYGIETLKKCINYFKDKYGLQVYLEPGEAVALNAGFLVCEVLETITNGMELAIVDTSAACHMPDVIEMPYRPNIIGASEPGVSKYTYRLGGPTCLAGDIIGDYSFDKLLQEGTRLIFTDMAIYSMVKNNTFNGMPLPSIAINHVDGTNEIVRQFGYEDFKMRL